MRWARGGEEPEGEEPGEETARMWRKEVVLYLREGLGRAGGVLEGMMVRRVEREMEKKRSVSHMSPGMGDAVVSGGGGGMVGGGNQGGRGAVEMEEEERKGEREGLSEEVVQMLEKENGELMRQFEDQLGQVRYAFFLSLALPLALPLAPFAALARSSLQTTTFLHQNPFNTPAEPPKAPSTTFPSCNRKSS